MTSNRIKKQIEDVFEELFLPIFMIIWAIGFGLVSLFIAISILWKVFCLL